MNKKFFRMIPTLIAGVLFVAISVKAQTIVRVMAYNILNYTSTDNNKTRYLDLRTVVSHFQPDVLIVSELIDGSGAQLLLDSGMNAAGYATFARAVFNNGPDTDNMLFYNTQKIKLKSQAQISTSLRDISHYRIYHVISAGDTAYLNLFSAHLKASNTTTDANDRLAEATAFCNYISSIPQNENLIIGGDFNFYSDQEPAWVLLTGTCSHQFYDPINMPGAWNNNSAFVTIHTQSTRSNTNPGCCGGSTGGLDDRFDFLLPTAPVMNGTSKVKYIPGTYKACGNDANHFNKAMIELPANSIVPAGVATSLFNMSDHLPVAMDLDIGNEVGINEFSSDENFSVQMCVDEIHSSALCFYSEKIINVQLEVFDIAGRKVLAREIVANQGFTSIKSQDLLLESGTYIIKAVSLEGETSSCIFIKE